MREVVEEALRLTGKNESFVIVTVTCTRGSTPQKAGAKLLVRQDGSRVGTLGGGCIEGDIWCLAKEILHKQGGPLLRKYDLNEEFAARDGLVCGGTMYFFLDPILKPDYFKPFITEIVQAYRGNSSVAMATVVSISNIQSNLGSKLLIKEDSSTKGSLGDPETDHEASSIGRAIASCGGNKIFQTRDGKEIFVEGYTSPPILVLMGGGHVSKATSKLAATLGFRIYVIDDRPEFASKERFPEAEGVVVADFDKGLEKIPVNPNTYIVVATRGHRYDDMALSAAVQTHARFIGLLGSKHKTLEIYKGLIQANVPLERLQEVRAPIGLNIGARTPEELAVSIMAEIVMIRNGGDGAPMKMDAKHLNNLVVKL
ncbi:MAG: XdhC/CoxI family protein [Candidatus Brocadia sp.]|nr:XdhC/CoxI family protein [Candidatus Brocadia sp.]